MSNTANWSYTSEATVYPLTGYDNSGVQIYGLPYVIKCTWKGETPNSAGAYLDSTGQEQISKTAFFTECNTIKKGDYIAKGNTLYELNPMCAKSDEVLDVLEDDMSFFGELPDYKVVT